MTAQAPSKEKVSAATLDMEIAGYAGEKSIHAKDVHALLVELRELRAEIERLGVVNNGWQQLHAERQQEVERLQQDMKQYREWVEPQLELLGRVTADEPYRSGHEPRARPSCSDCALVSIDDDTWRCTSCKSTFSRAAQPPRDVFYLCDVSLESGTGDDGFHPVMNRQGYASAEDAYLAGFGYVATLAANDNRSLQIRSEHYHSEYLLARNFRGTSECPICGVDTPHCHSRKEIAERTVDLRTSPWWPAAYAETMARKGFPIQDDSTPTKGL